ncbi:MAG: hypothetical protein JSV88_32400 [Candidatus Aminicenantes bacterium]|nr:MAG: hypothetical protein JSV88_32400 [Candidatus Aminicenantes bacterium]
MKQFFKCFNFEFKRSLRARNIMWAVLFALLALYFVNKGANFFNNIINTKENFKQIEKKKMEKCQNYKQMGEGGFRVIYIPPPVMIFFHNSGRFSAINAVIDIGERLYMDTSVKGKDMFTGKQGKYRDFAGVFFLFGILMVLFFGFESFQSVDYLKHLTAEIGFNRVFFPVLFARFAVIGVFFILVMGLGILVVFIKGIALSGSDYLCLAAFLALWLLLTLVLLAAGLMVSRIKDQKFAVGIIFLVWICLVFILPMATDQAAEDKAKSLPSNFQLELDKWNELMGFEERAKKELDKYSDENEKNKEKLNLVEGFFKRELMKILAIEKELEKSIRKIIAFYQKSSVIFPTTFYESVSHEMSGMGYGNSAGFFLYLVNLKYKFCVFIKEKRFYSDDDRVEPFIKDGEENVYYASAQIPGNYPLGMIVLVVYAAAMITGAYFLFRFAVLNMRTADTRAIKIKGKKLVFKKGEHVAVNASDSSIKDLLYCLLAGNYQSIRKKGFKESIIVNGNDILSGQKPGRFTYICDPRSLPQDSRVDDFFTFAARTFKISKEQKEKIMEIHGLTGLNKKLISQVEDHERADMTLALTGMIRDKKGKIYLFYNTAKGLTGKFSGRFKDFIIELKKDNTLVIYLSTNLEVKYTPTSGRSLFRFDLWDTWVDDASEFNKNFEKEEKQ